VSEYILPDLPYDYAALEPHIAGEIMQLHHDKHHATYVAGANTALEKMAEARETGNLAAVNLLEKNLAFNLGGHVNHSIFWANLSPDGGDKPTGELAAAIDENFGSFDGFRAHFEATALGIQGSGWSVLAWDTLGQRPLIFQLFDQQGNVPVGIVPLVMLDMWEHAFYLQYRNVKGDYVKAWWNVVNWADATRRFETARTQTAVRASTSWSSLPSAGSASTEAMYRQRSFIHTRLEASAAASAPGGATPADRSRSICAAAALVKRDISPCQRSRSSGTERHPSTVARSTASCRRHSAAEAVRASRRAASGAWSLRSSQAREASYTSSTMCSASVASAAYFDSK
jgi:Fe-Mn family superoxide dismutase